MFIDINLLFTQIGYYFFTAHKTLYIHEMLVVTTYNCLNVYTLYVLLHQLTTDSNVAVETFWNESKP